MWCCLLSLQIVLLLATNGAEALESIQTQKLNLVFLDVMMPKMNGFEVCQVVKQDPSTEDVHIIMLTAKGQEFARQKGKEVGANLYMTKPFEPDEIFKKASEILGLAEWLLCNW